MTCAGDFGHQANDVRSAAERAEAVEAFLQLVEKAAELGITAVLELIVFRDRPDTLERLKAVADVLVVLATAADAPGRADRRDLADPLLNRRLVLDALGHPTVESYIEGPGREIVRSGMLTTSELPTLMVRTANGLDPPVERIVDWVIERTHDHPVR